MMRWLSSSWVVLDICPPRPIVRRLSYNVHVVNVKPDVHNVNKCNPLKINGFISHSAGSCPALARLRRSDAVVRAKRCLIQEFPTADRIAAATRPTSSSVMLKFDGSHSP